MSYLIIFPDRRATSWQLEPALYAGVPSLERGPIPPPSAIITPSQEEFYGQNLGSNWEGSDKATLI